MGKKTKKENCMQFTDSEPEIQTTLDNVQGYHTQ